MSNTSEMLRQAAEEIRAEGIAGWGNACEQAADDYDALAARLAEAERIVRFADGMGAAAVAAGGTITLTQGAHLFTAAASYLVKHCGNADSATPCPSCGDRYYNAKDENCGNVDCLMHRAIKKPLCECGRLDDDIYYCERVPGHRCRDEQQKATDSATSRENASNG